MCNIEMEVLDFKIKLFDFLFTFCFMVFPFHFQNFWYSRRAKSTTVQPFGERCCFQFWPKIQQTKILVTCQSFDVLFLFGLVWQYSSIQKNIVQVGSKSRLLTCSNNITLSLPSYTDSASKRELNFCNGYLSLLYFWFWHCNFRHMGQIYLQVS